MSGSFYINPAAFMLCQNGKKHIRLGTEYDLELDDEKHKEFIKINEKDRTQAISLEGILRWFSIDEISEMFVQNVLIDQAIDLNDRYSRNECFYHVAKNIDGRKLREKEVLILGAGAVGSNMLWLFGTAGIKKVTMVDFDIVEASNLNRQMFYDTKDIGRFKLDVLKEKFPRFNPDTLFDTITKKIECEKDIKQLIDATKPDLLVLAIDTPENVHEWVNLNCVRSRIPYVSGGFMADKGILGPTYMPGKTSCFACVDRRNENVTERIAGTGPTLAPVVEYVASALFVEAVKVMTDMHENILYGGTMKLYDWETNSLTELEFPMMEECPVCHRKHRKIEYSDFRIGNGIYYLLCLIIPAVNLVLGGNPAFAAGALLLVNLLPAFDKSERNAYETAFCGSVVYMLSTLLFTWTGNASAFNLTGGIAARIYGFILIVLTTISLSSILFLGVELIYQALKKSFIAVFGRMV